MRDWDDFPYYRPAPARYVKGGIKAQSQRGAFGSSWWAKRWIQVLESFNIGPRLARGRSYARHGQVASISVGKGAVEALVQGSRAKPYRVTIKVKTIAARDWNRLARALSTQAAHTARLLAGEMPEDIEQAFLKAGVSLFPERAHDLKTDCSCPDWSNPCKHVAAVYYLLGEEFDRDPFVLLKLRGLDRQELLDLLSASARPGRTRAAQVAKSPKEPPVPEVRSLVEPLACDPARFWQQPEIPEGICGAVHVPGLTAGPLRQCGKFPFWRGNEPLLSALEFTYRAACHRGMAVFLGEQEPDLRTPPPR